MSLLEVEGVERRFGGVRALHDVTFGVAQGDIVGLIGPNGAGKSTLFSVIAGALTCSAGTVRYEGRRVTGWRPHQAAAAGVARTFQLMRVFGSMTVLENVCVGSGLRYRGRGHAQRKAMSVLETVGLAELAGVRAATLTAPSKKRLEVARALATEPKLLLLDEVLSGLTPAESAEAVELLRRIAASGVTILMVEHVMEVIMPLCDRIVVLDQGELIAEGTPTEVARHPAVIAAYLGQP